MSGTELVAGLRLACGSGDDSMLGGKDDDTMYGGTGADTMLGEAGNDDMTGWSGADPFSTHFFRGMPTVDAEAPVGRCGGA